MSNLRARLALGLTAAAAVAALLAPTGAAGATEFGDNCAANDLAPAPFGLFEVASPLNPLPTAAPSGGVITKWKVTSALPAPFALPHVLKVLRPLGTEAVFIVAEAPGSILPGTNSFDARIPIQAGDRLGLLATNEFGTLLCEAPGQPGVLGIFEPKGTPGQTVPAVQGPGAELRIPLSAILEPDADNDGFGDESQDRCPQSAALQAACPISVIDSFVLAKKGKVVVLVATSQTTAVTITGAAKFSKGRKARSSAQAKLAKVTKTVSAGQIIRFALNFPASLKSALRALPKGKSITLKLTATAPNVAGPATTDRARVKLRG